MAVYTVLPLNTSNLLLGPYLGARDAAEGLGFQGKFSLEVRKLEANNFSYIGIKSWLKPCLFLYF